MTHLLLDSSILHLFNPSNMSLLPIPQPTFLMNVFHCEPSEVTVLTSNPNAKAAFNAHVRSILEVVGWHFYFLICLRVFSGVVIKIE